MRAVTKYSSSKGASFQTYASYWIRASVLRAIAEADDVIRTPYHVNNAVNKILRGDKDRGWEEYRTAKEIAEDTGMGEDGVRTTLEVMGRRRYGYTEFIYGYHDGVMGGAGEEEVGGEGRPSTGFGEGVKGVLDDNEIKALELRFGIGGNEVRDKGKGETGRGGEERTFKEVGKVMQMSGEYARRLVERGINKLKERKEEGGLEEVFGL